VNRILQFYDGSMTVSVYPGHPRPSKVPVSICRKPDDASLTQCVLRLRTSVEGQPRVRQLNKTGCKVFREVVAAFKALLPAVHAIEFRLLDYGDHRIARQLGAASGRVHRPTGGLEGRELSKA
jgi:hypothetical protein